jgi:hypothetical protein
MAAAAVIEVGHWAWAHLTPPPAAGLEMAAAAVIEVDQPRPPEVTIARLQVWHNNRMTYWNMPILSPIDPY